MHFMHINACWDIKVPVIIPNPYYNRISAILLLT